MIAAAELSREFEALHVAKEAAFWAASPGLANDATAIRNDIDKEEEALSPWLR